MRVEEKGEDTIAETEQNNDKAPAVLCYGLGQFEKASLVGKKDARERVRELVEETVVVGAMARHDRTS